MSPLDATIHPVFQAGRVAVITGAASGIGAAAARELARSGLKVAIADFDETSLNALETELKTAWGDANVLAVLTDVSKLEDVQRLRDRVYDTWGEVAVLMNNAGVGIKGTSWEGIDNWKKIFDINVFGIVNMQQTFIPYMLPQENPSVVINTGSKQGITNPPGNSAYNAAKAAVKSLTESLAYDLRSQATCNVTAHLFIPGWTWTKLTGNSGSNEKPAGAWTAEETVLYMLDRVRFGDFYILVPDNETRPEVDALRIMWSAGDVTECRPALSRWHPNYKSIFQDYMQENLAQMG